jgi:hypothetical protein
MLPIAGTVIVTVATATPVSIHGDLYLDLQVNVDGASDPTMLRVPAHTMPPGDDGTRRVPAAGDRLQLQVLLGQVDSVRFVEG